ncbi:DNA gyrase subunit A [Candidatus Woesearchaeota archaeon]|nr:MAG: DNA gyrase subunit A [archaeon GW2011_AR4]MBS3130380.1 DNA gyrase subunit A [Candidatus Woesearchaeota archaeon]HIH38245.1 DNA gyrase subunit A [Candidatus Woesearchaeota archaeon]HIH49092.1 DNA gyrase subunit A [Candidatus Woesearchaeota archaeon]HIJ04169.1 DNA gyrase subunit A [Candidatus Woesearchaeota archaeon]
MEKESSEGHSSVQPSATEPVARIFPREIEEEMKQSYVDYAMSVIVGRALPDVRDGMKPVHRRILYAMNDMGLVHNKPFKKSARIVGEVLGKYHPHGDTAVYDSLVRMAQDFSLRYPLVDGQGNFGSVDGDNPAAMRYTEARLKKIAEELLQDIDKETVSFTQNFDNSLTEPSVLPSKLPSLLMNGSSGIAVGMATNIPPHNLKELCKATIALIKNPELSMNELIEYLPGPDFPTGGIIKGVGGIRSAYKNGRGLIKVSSQSHVEEIGGKQAIVITEIPYMVNKATMVEQTAELIQQKVLEDISDIRDESNREGIRVIFELKKGAQPDIVLNQLLKHTRLQVTFGINFVALVNNQPRTLSLKALLQHFIDHRKDVVYKRTAFDLKKAEERAHILEGLTIALDNIDAVVQKIKKSRDAPIALAMLQKDYSLTELQAKAILEMRLQRLASMEQEKIRTELSELKVKISELKGILSSNEKIFGIIIDELDEAMTQYGDDRRTIIESGDFEEIDREALIKPEQMVVTITHAGYIKRTAMALYREQKRGGRGIKAAGTKEEDFVKDVFVANTHDTMLFFTNKGMVHWLKVYDIPETARHAKGKPVVNLISLSEGENISAIVPVDTFDDYHFILMGTEQGIVKKTNLIEYSRPRKGGIIGITLREGDSLIEVKLTDGKQQVILATTSGMANRFNEEEVRPMGRGASGVIGIRLKAQDKVVGMVLGEDDHYLLTITEQGYGKRTTMSEYRLTARGSSGVRNIICSERNGVVVGVLSVVDNDQVLFISKNGVVIRTSAAAIRPIGRNTQGVRLMKLEEEDSVASAARIPPEDDPEENSENSKELKELKEPRSTPRIPDELDELDDEEPSVDKTISQDDIISQNISEEDFF